MSMPKIPDINPNINIDREDAINILIASVGLEEMALAHILNAEGEKIQYVLGTLDGRDPGDVTVCDVMNVNESVNKTLKNVVATEMLLLFKLEDAINLDGSEARRKNITVRKMWTDDNNAHNTRPVSVGITLLRDGEIYDTAMLTSGGGWSHTFKGLPVGDDSKQYVYAIDETPAPDGYTKSVSGYNITNTLNEITISGVKTWNDNHNAENKRPTSITVLLKQNGTQIRTLNLTTPAGQDTAQFNFNNVPFADSQGNPYVYTVSEYAIVGYLVTIDGFNITNTLITRGFSFSKTSMATGLSLQGAVFEIRQNGTLISTSSSDAAGRVSFSNLLPGAYQMAETIPPVGYMDNTHIYDVVISDDGTITIDGMPSDEFNVMNMPEAVNILLARATDVEPAYMAAPNSWPLHGTIEPDLYMLDRILITLPYTPVLVKWAYGIQDATYFRTGGGTNITSTYQDGIPAPLNTDYTVYALFGNGIDAVASITIDRIRDGSVEMPYLLIDFSTANALESSIPGINQFTLFYMQGGGLKLNQDYEIYENLQMSGKLWEPLGTLSASYVVAEGFTGTLYGNGHDIINLAINVQRTDDFIGLFRAVSDGARIENLGIVNSDIGNVYYPAGFAACVNIGSGSAVFKDLRFTGSVTGTNYTGGIISYANVVEGSLDISGCSVDAVVKGGTGVGGVMGICFLQATGTLVVDNCYAAGSVTALNSNSGIVGTINSKGGASSITNCANAMAVNGSSSTGGILGIILPQAVVQVKISSCYNKGYITAITDVGGIVGSSGSYAYESSISVENCYNSGTVSATGTNSGVAVGGLAGVLRKQNSIKNSYNTGDVFCLYTDVSPYYFYTGGISASYGIVENCASVGGIVSNFNTGVARISQYWTENGSLSNNVAFDNMQVLINGVQKSPLDTGSSGKDGISTAAAVLKTQAFYENTLGWDFTNVWGFGNGAYTLPVLRSIPASLQPTILPGHLV